jgi:hypothetical protein
MIFDLASVWLPQIKLHPIDFYYFHQIDADTGQESHMRPEV